MRLARSATLTLLLVLSAASAHAQTIPSPFRYIETKRAITPFIGYLATGTGRIDVGPKSAPLLGGRFDLHLTGPLSGQFGLGLVSTERTIHVLPAASPDSLEAIGEDKMFLAMAEAGMHFRMTGPRTWRGMAPFAVGSLAVVLDLSGQSELEAELPVDQIFEFGPAFAATLGLGNEFFIGERLSVRAEARDFFWRYTYPAGLVASGVRENQWTQNIALTLGASFHF
jgi:hypothetical protein